MSRVARSIIPLLVVLSGCATGTSGLDVRTEAVGTVSFQLGKPALYPAASGVDVIGSACRIGTNTALSPRRVRIEHLSATSEIVDVATAPMPWLSTRADQRCGHYSLAVTWNPADGETVRACFDRGHACPAP